MDMGCDSGERVHIAFSLDCYDRVALSYSATTGAISGDMARDLMLESMQWLSDNGSANTDDDTRDFGALLGLQPCTTPYRSPESNGILCENIQEGLCCGTWRCRCYRLDEIVTVHIRRLQWERAA
jgi:transposase InsO family protein